ncbi:GNAT family N-acetyltransferase [Rhodoplanes sp.]|uniref:GNAT family N-acetyltransferase n=1 Tax=Rhodoplanes sp. TaxID=1968906 RepID=UPI0025FBDC57|nr:GNAT family N-acetyltransferase [Rhodoplanes sp.]
MPRPPAPPPSIRPFGLSDYPAARALWERSDGIGLSAADEIGAIEAFLARNPGLSFVAVVDDALAGTILCGHDGRRGLIYHLIVAEPYRRRAIGAALLRHGLRALRGAGVDKCHMLVFTANRDGIAFWHRVGAQERVTLTLFSMATRADGGPDAG